MMWKIPYERLATLLACCARLCAAKNMCDWWKGFEGQRLSWPSNCFVLSSKVDRYFDPLYNSQWKALWYDYFCSNGMTQADGMSALGHAVVKCYEMTVTFKPDVTWNVILLSYR